jgi:acetoin utilization protein AcuB
MSKAIPQITKYMSTNPVVTTPTATLGHAKKLMLEANIRHLPVLDGAELLGVVTASDLRAIEALAGTKPESVKVLDIMRKKPFTCSPDSALDEVVAEMVAHKWGSAVVTQNGHVVGMFTAIDAMSALVELTRTRLAK